jgi:hypothetical protein
MQLCDCGNRTLYDRYRQGKAGNGASPSSRSTAIKNVGDIHSFLRSFSCHDRGQYIPWQASEEENIARLFFKNRSDVNQFFPCSTFPSDRNGAGGGTVPVW